MLALKTKLFMEQHQVSPQVTAVLEEIIKNSASAALPICFYYLLEVYMTHYLLAFPTLL